MGKRLAAHLSSLHFPVLPLYHSDTAECAPHSWRGDLTRLDHWAEFERASVQPDTVIHLAGFIDIQLSPSPSGSDSRPIPGKENLSKLYSVNVGGTANLLQFCLKRQVKHLIFASSQTVYGLPQTALVTEDSPCSPLEHYAASKACCEELLRVGSSQGLNVTALRFPGLYSEERESGVVYQFCLSGLQEKEIAVRAEFPLPLDVIHREDVVLAFERALLWGGRSWSCFNISTGEACSLDLLADSVASLISGCKVRHSPIFQPAIRLDASKAFAALAWKAVPRRERLSQMIDKLKATHRL